jgi:hypothetical protein
MGGEWGHYILTWNLRVQKYTPNLDEIAQKNEYEN